MRRHRSPVVVLSVLAASLAATVSVGAAPVCVDVLPGVNERCPAWTASYNHTGGRGGRGEDVLRDLALSPDGASLYATGESYDDTTRQDQVVVAVNASTGATRWSARYDAQGLFDTGSAIDVAPDGSAVYAAGRSSGSGTGFDWITVAYDAVTGERLWVARLETPGSDRTWGVAASADGSAVYVVGEVDGRDIGAVAYDAETGDVLWEGSFDNGGYDWALDIAVSPDGETVYAAGTSGAAATAVDLSVVAFRTIDEEDHEAGSVRWARLVDAGNRLSETFGGLDISEDGAWLALGGFTTRPDTTIAGVTAAIDAESGDVAWVKLTDGRPADSDQRDSVAIRGGRVVRTSWISPDAAAGGEFATHALALDDGRLLWSAMHGTGPTRKDTAKTTAFSPDGTTVYVSGYSVLPYGETNGFRFEPGHVTTVAYDAATGAKEWVAQHDHSGIGSDFAAALVPSHDGQRIYIGATFIMTGVRVTPTDLAMAYAYDLGVLAYDA